MHGVCVFNVQHSGASTKVWSGFCNRQCQGQMSNIWDSILSAPHPVRRAMSRKAEWIKAAPTLLSSLISGVTVSVFLVASRVRRHGDIQSCLSSTKMDRPPSTVSTTEITKAFNNIWDPTLTYWGVKEACHQNNIWWVEGSSVSQQQQTGLLWQMSSISPWELLQFLTVFLISADVSVPPLLPSLIAGERQ